MMMMIIRETENEQRGCLCSAHPDVKGPSEVVQVGLDETNVLQTQLGAPTLSPEQRLLLVLDENDLHRRAESRLVEWLTSTFISGGSIMIFQNMDVQFNSKGMKNTPNTAIINTISYSEHILSFHMYIYINQIYRTAFEAMVRINTHSTWQSGSM